ncbi:uncharacterized protein LOC135378705 [Ornithodoros turicata]|uniref:uncharacterized protein LOC135378705 n=1 Tax=Ornithodoros turicata TaxID=34597 RepID=UPI003138B4B5
MGEDAGLATTTQATVTPSETSSSTASSSETSSPETSSSEASSSTASSSTSSPSTSSPSTSSPSTSSPSTSSLSTTLASSTSTAGNTILCSVLRNSEGWVPAQCDIIFVVVRVTAAEIRYAGRNTRAFEKLRLKLMASKVTKLGLDFEYSSITQSSTHLARLNAMVAMSKMGARLTGVLAAQVDNVWDDTDRAIVSVLKVSFGVIHRRALSTGISMLFPFKGLTNIRDGVHVSFVYLSY